MIYLIGLSELDTEIVLIPEIAFSIIIGACKVINQGYCLHTLYSHCENMWFGVTKNEIVFGHVFTC